MKKYFIAKTDEELEFGDTIQLDLTKETKHGVKKVRGEVTFSPAVVDMLLEIDAIEEREEEEVNTPENDLLDFGDETPCEELEALIEDYEDLEERVDKLEEKVEKFIDMHKDFVKLTTDMLDTFREFTLGFPEKKATAQPKKK